VFSLTKLRRENSVDSAGKNIFGDISRVKTEKVGRDRARHHVSIEVERRHRFQKDKRINIKEFAVPIQHIRSRKAFARQVSV